MTAPFSRSRLVTAPIAAPVTAPIAASRFVLRFTTTGWRATVPALEVRAAGRGAGAGAGL
jgi:hypothetical protein